MTLDDVIAQYGDPNAPGFEAQNIAGFDLPYPLVYGSAMVRRSRAHRLAIPAFLRALEAVKDRGLVERATTYGGIYAVRSIRGHAGHPSAHSWGCAIDLNPTDFPLGSERRQDPGVVACFREAGFVAGEDFKARRDPMHFTLLGF